MTGNAEVLEGAWKMVGKMICGHVCVSPVREAVWVPHISVFTGPWFAKAEKGILWDGEQCTELPVELSGIWCESILHFW